MSKVPHILRAQDFRCLGKVVSFDNSVLAVDPSLGAVLVDPSYTYHSPILVEPSEEASADLRRQVDFLGLKKSHEKFEIVSQRVNGENDEMNRFLEVLERYSVESFDVVVIGRRPFVVGDGEYYYVNPSNEVVKRKCKYIQAIKEPLYTAIVCLDDEVYDIVYGTWYSLYRAIMRFSKIGEVEHVALTSGAVYIAGTRGNLILYSDRVFTIAPKFKKLLYFDSLTNTALFLENKHLLVFDAEMGKRKFSSYLGSDVAHAKYKYGIVLAGVGNKLKILHGRIWRYLDDHEGEIKFTDILKHFIVIGDDSSTHIYRFDGAAIEKAYTLNSMSNCIEFAGYLYCLTHHGTLYKLNPEKEVPVELEVDVAPCRTSLVARNTGFVRSVNSGKPLLRISIENLPRESKVDIFSLLPLGKSSVPVTIVGDLKNVYLELPVYTPSPTLEDVEVYKKVFSSEGYIEYNGALYKGLIEGRYRVSWLCREGLSAELVAKVTAHDNSRVVGSTRQNVTIPSINHFRIYLSDAPGKTVILQLELRTGTLREVVEVPLTLEFIKAPNIREMLRIFRDDRAGVNIDASNVPLDVLELLAICGNKAVRGTKKLRIECDDGSKTLIYIKYKFNDFIFEEGFSLPAKITVPKVVCYDKAPRRSIRDKSLNHEIYLLPTKCLKYTLRLDPHSRSDVGYIVELVNLCNQPAALILEGREPVIVPPRSKHVLRLSRSFNDLLFGQAISFVELTLGCYGQNFMNLGLDTALRLGYLTLLKLREYLKGRW